MYVSARFIVSKFLNASPPEGLWQLQAEYTTLSVELLNNPCLMESVQKRDCAHAIGIDFIGDFYGA
jgi:hypothetical protein